jgi:D-3-phosphoglycerate dehydrogenase
MNTPGQNTTAVAALAIGMMIFMSRNCFNPGTGSELKGKTIGIHAYGNVGRLVAKLAKGFDMNVIAFDPFVDNAKVKADGVTPVSSIEELYEKSDFLSLHIPATSETKKSVGTALMSRMPKGACLINTARKEVINEDELMEILEKRPDLKYVTDIAADNQTALNEKFGIRVFSTPKKMGAETGEANVNAGLASANQIVKFFATGDKTFQVNK